MLLEPNGAFLFLHLFSDTLHFYSSYDSTSGGEREIQRTMLELLNQLDGFDTRGDVKVIMATNRIDSLDPALIRPGRIDRKIEFPLPDVKTKRHIFRYIFSLIIVLSRLTLAQITYIPNESKS